MADEERDFERILAESEAFLADHAIDVSATQVLEQRPAALYARTWALFKLGRFRQSLDAAQRLVGYWAEHAAEGLRDEWLADALLVKRAALTRLGRRAEAAEVDAETIIRFRDAEDAGLRRRAAESMSYRSGFLLRDPRRISQGMALSDELIEMLAEEPEDSVLELAEIATQHMRLLMSAHSQSVMGIATMTLELAARNAAAASEALAADLFERVGWTAPEMAALRERLAALTPPALTRTRARACQALKVGQAVLTRLEPLPDAEVAALRARTELTALLCRVALGEAREAARAMEAMHARRDPDVAQAYQSLIDEQADHRGALGQLGAAAMLAGRAEALIGDDPVMARLAYEDSLAAQLPAARSWPLRWLLARMAPGSAAKG